MSKFRWNDRRPTPDERADFRDLDRHGSQTLAGRAERAERAWLETLSPVHKRGLSRKLKLVVLDMRGELERQRRREREMEARSSRGPTGKGDST